ncbi:MAG: TraM recognition domain-containing protein [Egibacteraceae bacterium]
MTPVWASAIDRPEPSSAAVRWSASGDPSPRPLAVPRPFGSSPAAGLLDPRLLLALDEAGNIAALRYLPTLATTGRGQGIALLSIFHDLGQLRHRYGAQADTVVKRAPREAVPRGAGRPRLVGAGGPADRRRADRRDFCVAAHLAAAGAGRVTHAGRASRPLIPAAQVRQLRKRQAVLIYGHLPAVKIRLRAWWRSPALRRRARGGAR